MLKHHQIEWDNKTLDYDLSRYDFTKWALKVVQEIHPSVNCFETLHEKFTSAEVLKIQYYVQAAFLRKDWMELIDSFFKEYAEPRINNLPYLIQRQATMRVVIPNQSKENRKLIFHQGIFVGNGRGCRTVWSPLTEARDTNTMWILSLEDSRRITRQTILEKWSMEKFEEESLRCAWPVNLKPGQSHLFFQEHIHGNVNNDEGYTRVSIDARLLLKGEEYGRRSPGGFFRFPGDYYTSESVDLSDKNFISFVSWASEYGNNINYPMQRSNITRYCNMFNIKLAYEDGEFDNNNWHMMFEWYLRTANVDGIVLPSIQSLPDDEERRNELLNLALNRGIELHFADEFLVMRNEQDLQKINTYLTFAVRKKDPYVWEE